MMNMVSFYEVTSLSVVVGVEKQRRFLVDNLMLGVQLAEFPTRSSSHTQGKSEVVSLPFYAQF